VRRERKNTISPTCRRKADLRTLAATIKARWICEQAHQQLIGKLRRKLAAVAANKPA
jgi:hypothetical protein